MTTITLAATGQTGVHGTQQWDNSTAIKAPRGSFGRQGRDASFPTSGTSGGEIHVGLSFDPARPGVIQVTGQAHRMGERYQVGGKQSLLLDCRGGDGGHGGLGENGQSGGDGFDGRDATQTSEATDGSPGMNGGDGGRGTSGANGGAGGHAHVMVNEEDLDTLIGVEWDVRGGNGGFVGEHGAGGAGGHGGDGGAGCTWSERYVAAVHTNANGQHYTEYATRYHSRPAGRGGPGGMAGRTPNDLLYPGQDGQMGYSEVIVNYRDGRRGVFPSRYMLEVVDFKVHDENGDGINEPGERLIISDIVIKNTGQMPSPKISRLQILVRGTKWLEPILEPLDIPAEIPPGHSVKVPGVLKAWIKNETVDRGSGTLLRAQDTVSLRAYSQRLQRDVPEFSGGVAIVCQYPLLMTTPKYLDSVAKGDIVTFSWTIQNISTKSQGRIGTLQRETGTHLSDPNGMFDLKRAPKDTPHDIMDIIEVIKPGEVIPVTVDFQVSELVNEFTTGNMFITLILSDPHGKKMRNVVAFDLRIQISPSYRYNPAARFLLVINGSSPNAFVLQLLHFLQLGLHLPVDIFNLSLSGAYTTADTRDDILANYSGKTIILLGNPMNYFQDGQRHPWELLDIDQAFELAKAGTNFLVISPENMQSLKGFSHLLSSGVSPFLPPDSFTQTSNIKDLLIKLTPKTSATPSRAVLPVKKKLMKKLEKTLAATAKSTQKKLTDMFPLRRFLIAPSSPIADPKAKETSLDVIEGLPHSTKLVATLQPFRADSPVISEYNMVMLAHSLPFSDQCSIFWNLAGVDTTYGVPTSTIYKGPSLSHLRVYGDDSTTTQKVSGKALESLTWSLSTLLASEITHFRSGSGTSSLPLLSQLPLLSRFIASFPGKGFTPPEVTATFTPLTQLLGFLRGVTCPLTFGQKLGANLTKAGKRRTRLRHVVLNQLCGPVVKAMPPLPKKMTDAEGVVTKNKPPGEEVVDVERDTKRQILEVKKSGGGGRGGGGGGGMNRIQRVNMVCSLLLEALTRTEGVGFVDVINDHAEAGREGARVLGSYAEYEQLLVKLEERRGRLERDVEYSFGRLSGMVQRGGTVRAEQQQQIQKRATEPGGGGGGGGDRDGISLVSRSMTVSPVTTVASPIVFGRGMEAVEVLSGSGGKETGVAEKVEEVVYAHELPLTVPIRGAELAA
ncbi:hypothetical protein QBC41DRAFT_346031 [Cercophora samala]|uniref:DUF7932 domain-containing protein n=1 Tax=Cercophora samala TaxID=330535 RepID=A0AA39ZF64_9PEZI|nr:hypothetical protein QBC41DRAFT_346031 [Cercophora samala]